MTFCQHDSMEVEVGAIYQKKRAVKSGTASATYAVIIHLR